MGRAVTARLGLAGAAHDDQGPVDLSGATARASAAAASPRLSEAELFRGHGPCVGCGAYPCRCTAYRRERCACGVTIVAELGNWRAAREYGDYLAVIRLEGLPA